MSYQEPSIDLCGKATYKNGINENYSESYQNKFGKTLNDEEEVLEKPAKSPKRRI